MYLITYRKYHFIIDKIWRQKKEIIISIITTTTEIEDNVLHKDDNSVVIHYQSYFQGSDLFNIDLFKLK
jgi:hypothetical protein